MSIVAMKNKSRGYNKPISGKQYVGFALNGTLRNQGYIGQDSLSHKLIKTPFKGNYPVGHGGHLGKYPVTKIFSCSSCFNDPSVVKKSTMNNLSHIYSILPSRNNPIVAEKSIDTNKAGNYVVQQEEYINFLTSKVASCSTADEDKKNKNVNNNNNNNNNNNTNNNNNKNNNNKDCGSYAKMVSSISYSDYIRSLIYKKKCVSGNV